MTITDRIKPHVADIIRDAENGNSAAINVINLHRMHVSCPSDQGAIGLCEAAFEDWQKNAAMGESDE